MGRQSVQTLALVSVPIVPSPGRRIIFSASTRHDDLTAPPAIIDEYATTPRYPYRAPTNAEIIRYYDDHDTTTNEGTAPRPHPRTGGTPRTNTTTVSRRRRPPALIQSYLRAYLSLASGRPHRHRRYPRSSRQRTDIVTHQGNATRVRRIPLADLPG